jgi:signal peptidase I
MPEPAPRLSQSDDRSRELAGLLLHNAQQFDAIGKALAGGDRSIEIPIVGNSMGAALPNGTIVSVALGDGSTCAPGDVVVFRQGEQIVAHRVVHLAAGIRYLVTRGDARIAADAPVPFSSVLGRVTEVGAGYRRRLLRWAGAPFLFVAVVTLHVNPTLSTAVCRILIAIERATLRVWRAMGSSRAV